MSTTEMTKRTSVKEIAVWILSGLLAFMFVLAGFMKFTAPEMGEKFAGWGYADWFRYLIGAVEIVFGVALVFRKTARYAALLLAAVMVGAIYTLVAHGEIPEAAAPLVFLLLLGVVAYARRPTA